MPDPAADDTELDAGIAALRDLAETGRRRFTDGAPGDAMEDILFVMIAPACLEVGE